MGSPACPDITVKSEFNGDDDKTIIEHFVDENRGIWNSTDEVLLEGIRNCDGFEDVDSTFVNVKLENYSHIDISFMKTEDDSHEYSREVIAKKENVENESIKTEDNEDMLHEDSLPDWCTMKKDEDISENMQLNMEERTNHVYDSGTHKSIAPEVEMDNIHTLQKKTTTRGCPSKKYHLRPDTNNPKLLMYQCNFCYFSSFIKSTLKHHVDRTHLQQRSLKCKYCDYVTVEKYRLRYHVEGVHLKMNNFKCHLCDYSAAVKSNVDRHIDCVHIQLKTYKCDFCDYTAKLKNYLRLHVERVHANVKNHKCQMCTYSATRKNDLQRHIDNVHLQLRNQKCPLCEYKTTQKGNIKRHLKRIHSKE